jgi:hypothetical protein
MFCVSSNPAFQQQERSRDGAQLLSIKRCLHGREIGEDGRSVIAELPHIDGRDSRTWTAATLDARTIKALTNRRKLVIGGAPFYTLGSQKGKG